MSATLITTIVMTVLAAIIITITGIRKKRQKYENEIVPHICFGTKIFLKRKEIPKFERASKYEKKRQLNKFKARIKRGQLVRVMEDGEIVGYVNKKSL